MLGTTGTVVSGFLGVGHSVDAYLDSGRTPSQSCTGPQPRAATGDAPTQAYRQMGSPSFSYTQQLGVCVLCQVTKAIQFSNKFDVFYSNEKIHELGKSRASQAGEHCSHGSFIALLKSPHKNKAGLARRSHFLGCSELIKAELEDCDWG